MDWIGYFGVSSSTLSNCFDLVRTPLLLVSISTCAGGEDPPSHLLLLFQLFGCGVDERSKVPLLVLCSFFLIQTTVEAIFGRRE